MRFYLAFIFSFLFTLNAFCQVSKIYITADNKYSDLAINAVSYILVEKYSDSAYSVRQFNMQGAITMAGSYKDDQLSIQHGKFSIYKTQAASKRIRYNYSLKKADTVITPLKNYVCTKGFFINGVKAGQWIDYNSDGRMEKLNTYHNGKLNGVFKSFGVNNQVEFEGNYLDDKKNGTWYTFSFKGDTSAIEYYSEGVLKKSVSYLSDKKFKSHLKTGEPSYDLSHYINRKISREDRDTIYKGYYGKYTFTLTKEGKLTNAIVERVNNLKIDTDIIELFLAAPLWKPTTIDNNTVESQLEIDVAPLTQNGKIVSVFSQILSTTVAGYNGY